MKKFQEKTYNNPIELTEDLWKFGSKKNKERLLESLKLDKSWAKTKTINEMVKRGGGLTAKSLLNLNKLYLERKPNRMVTIKW